MPECDHTCEVPSWRHVPDTCLRGLRGLRVHRQAGQCCFLTEDTTMNAGDPGDPGSLPGWIRWETLAIKHDLPWPSMTTGDGLWCLYHLQWWWCLYIYIPPTSTYNGEAWWGLVIFDDIWWLGWPDYSPSYGWGPTNGQRKALDGRGPGALNAVESERNRYHQQKPEDLTWYVNIYIYDDSDHYHPHHEKKRSSNIIKYHWIIQISSMTKRVSSSLSL